MSELREPETGPANRGMAKLPCQGRAGRRPRCQNLEFHACRAYSANPLYGPQQDLCRVRARISAEALGNLEGALAVPNCEQYQW